MLGCGGSRISQHLRDCTHHSRRCHRHLPFSTVLTAARITHLSSFFSVTPPRHSFRYRRRLQHRLVSSSSLQSKSSGEIPIFSDCFSQREDNAELPPEGLSSVAGGIVALGKFDALHIGHRELAIQASKVGVPYLLSFVGMAEVLGWEPRAPIVAKCDRNRVLHSWAPFCGNVAPSEFQIEFSSVRKLSPRQFVEKLSRELGVSGVVAGKNYRFGYKAAGDASELVRLCEECGIRAYIINSVMDKNQDPRSTELGDFQEKGQVSSTRVRHALAIGDMKYVSELLGRKHRLMLMLNDPNITRTTSGWSISAPKSCLLNLPPTDGFYGNCFLLSGDENPLLCRVFIDATHIHLELDDDGLFSSNRLQDFQLLGIEFGD